MSSNDRKEVTTTAVNPPTLPPLYFAQEENNEQQQPLTPTLDPTPTLTLLPSEVLCNITNFLDWGEYARLSATCKQFSTMVHDAATTVTVTTISQVDNDDNDNDDNDGCNDNDDQNNNNNNNNNDNPKWDLALALLNGTNGLAQNPKRAIQYLQDLARPSSFTTSGDGNGNGNNEHGGNSDGDMAMVVCGDEYEPSYQPTMQMVEIDAYVNSNVNSNANASANVSDDAENKTEGQQSKLKTKSTSASTSTSTSTQAMKKLAACYLTGTGIPTNQNLGLTWLKTAHYHGDIDAAYDIATIYEYSKYAVPVDIYAAASWFHAGALSGHVECMAEYAMCLELGCGVEQSDDGALDWYTKAAERGHVTSNYSVGEMFEMARGGLPQSDTEAVLWYYKAAMMGCEDSVLALERLSDIARIVLPGWAATLNE